MRALVGLVVVDCGAGARSAEPLSQHVPHATACLPAAQRDDGLQMMLSRGGVAHACYGTDMTQACLVVDANASVRGQVARRYAADTGSPSPRPLTLEGGRFKACVDSRCTTFASPYPAPSQAFRIERKALDPSGERALVIVSELKPGIVPSGSVDEYVIYADVLDVATGMRTTHAKLSQIVDSAFIDDSLGHTAAFANHALLIGEWEAGPDGLELLVDPVRDVAMVAHRYDGETEVVDPHTIWLRADKSFELVDTDTLHLLASYEAQSAGSVRLGTHIVIASSRPAPNDAAAASSSARAASSTP